MGALEMPRGKVEHAEVILPKLREVEVELGRGKTVAEAVKKIGVTELTYDRWKKKYGGLRMNQAKRLKDLEKENSRLRRLLADAELDKAMLRDVAEGRPWAAQLNV
jgi:putative transposase